MPPKKHHRAVLAVPRTRKNKLVGPWCKSGLCNQHRNVIEDGLADYRNRRKDLQQQYVAGYKQLLARHTRELAKLNEHIKHVTENFPELEAPPQTEGGARNCPRFNQAARAKHAKSRAGLLYKRLLTRIPRLDPANKAMKADCGVCWECQRAALLCDQDREKQHPWEGYSRDVRHLHDEFVTVVGFENLPWVPPRRGLEESVKMDRIDRGWQDKPLWKQWLVSFSYRRRKSY
jgi:hypothetical protein